MRADGGGLAVLAPGAAVVGEVTRSGVVIQGLYLPSTHRGRDGITSFSVERLLFFRRAQLK